MTLSRFAPSFLALSLAALSGAPAFALDPGWQLAADRGCYNCHGEPERDAVPSFKHMMSNYSRLGGKASADFLRHEVGEMREAGDVLVHREVSDEDAQAIIQWLVESGGRAAAGKLGAR